MSDDGSDDSVMSMEEEVLEDVMEYEDEEPQELAENRVEIVQNGQVPPQRPQAAHLPQPQAIPKDKRTTTPYLTKYERARLLGTRALQISMNAPVMVDLQGESDPLEIALKELREKKIPLMVRRYLPDGSWEDWSVEELIVE